MKQPRRSLILALACLVVAQCVISFCYLLPMKLTLSWSRGSGTSAQFALVIGVIFLALVFVLSPLGRRARQLKLISRQLSSSDAQAVLRRDSRAPILYLRSFDHDEAEAAGYAPLIVPVKTTEEALVNEFKRLGPVIAIGKPGERLQTLGAARMYVSGDWRGVVLDLIRKADAVVLRPGRSQGFWWEVKQVRQIVSPQKVVFYFASSDDLVAFQEEAPKTIADSANWLEDAPSTHGSTNDAAFLLFSEGWRPMWLTGGPRNIRELVRAVEAKMTMPDCDNALNPLADGPVTSQGESSIGQCPYCESRRGADVDGYCRDCQRPT